MANSRSSRHRFCESHSATQLSPEMVNSSSNGSTPTRPRPFATAAELSGLPVGDRRSFAPLPPRPKCLTTASIERSRKSAIPITSHTTTSFGSFRRRMLSVPVRLSASRTHSIPTSERRWPRLSGRGLRPTSLNHFPNPIPAPPHSARIHENIHVVYDLRLKLLALGLDAWRSTGARVLSAQFLGLLAEALEKSGESERGLALVEEALGSVSKTGEGWCESELHR